MARRLWLLGFLLGIPIVGFAIAENIRFHFNSEVKTAVQRSYPDASSAVISQLSIDSLCKERDRNLADLCSTNDHLHLMSRAAVWSGVTGLALLLAIQIAAYAARSNRQLLLRLFKPGFYITAAVITGLILLHAVIAIAAIYYGESIYAGRLHVKLIALIGIGAAIGVVALSRSVFSLVQKVHTTVIGKEITKTQAPALWERVEGLAKQMNALPPERIVVGLDPNFFVTEANVTCLDGTVSGRTLYCSLPLCRILEDQEFASIIGHELGHFKGLDTQYSQQFYPIYRGTISSITSLKQSGGEHPLMTISLLPAIAVLNHFLEQFSVAERTISRARELEADQQGMLVTDEMTFGSALVKVHAFGDVWEQVRQASVRVLHEGKLFRNTSTIYSAAVASIATPGVFDNIADKHLAHPTDSHPPLSTRLAALKIQPEAVFQKALVVQPVAPSINLLPGAEEIEQHISAVYQGILAQEYGIDLQPNSVTSSEEPCDKECPSCAMFNPESATKCLCGFVFEHSSAITAA
jgi:Zn-dependent protease with chaperone function